MKFDITIFNFSNGIHQALVRITGGTTINIPAQANTHRTVFVQDGHGLVIQKDKEDLIVVAKEWIEINRGETISLQGISVNRVFCVFVTSTTLITENSFVGQ